MDKTCRLIQWNSFKLLHRVELVGRSSSSPFWEAIEYTLAH